MKIITEDENVIEIDNSLAIELLCALLKQSGPEELLTFRHYSIDWLIGIAYSSMDETLFNKGIYKPKNNRVS